MQHLLDIASLGEPQLQRLLQLTAEIARQPKAYSDRLRGRFLFNLFMEPSTRTRMSFETAAKRLGMQVVNFHSNASSAVKGETLEDTFQTLQAMRPDAVAVRHSKDGAVAALAATATTHVINAGDGCAHHPTQALLDVVTLKQVFGDVSGLSLAIVGDVRHSRVAGSGIDLFRRLGLTDIRLAGPPGMLPAAADGGLRRCGSIDEALAGANVVMMLRIQRERLGESEQPDAERWFKEWGLTSERLVKAAPDCVVMHPGPVNRGVEIASDVADGERSLITRQVANGVFTRMAVLLSLLQGEAAEEPSAV